MSKRLTPSLVIFLSKSLKITVETQKFCINLVKNYLSDRQQRVRLSENYPRQPSSRDNFTERVYENCVTETRLPY